MVRGVGGVVVWLVFVGLFCFVLLFFALAKLKMFVRIQPPGSFVAGEKL